MNLNLALVVDATPTTCTIRWLGENENTHAHYSPQVQNRIKIFPHQLVAVDAASTPPQVVWRWFRGRVDYQVADHVVVNNHIYQAGFRAPISVARVPDELETPLKPGDEVFYSLGAEAVVIDCADEGFPVHPERLRADMLPAIVEIYSEYTSKEA